MGDCRRENCLPLVAHNLGRISKRGACSAGSGRTRDRRRLSSLESGEAGEFEGNPHIPGPGAATGRMLALPAADAPSAAPDTVEIAAPLVPPPATPLNEWRATRRAPSRCFALRAACTAIRAARRFALESASRTPIRPARSSPYRTAIYATLSVCIDWGPTGVHQPFANRHGPKLGSATDADVDGTSPARAAPIDSPTVAPPGSVAAGVENVKDWEIGYYEDAPSASDVGAADPALVGALTAARGPNVASVADTTSSRSLRLTMFSDKGFSPGPLVGRWMYSWVEAQ